MTTGITLSEKTDIKAKIDKLISIVDAAPKSMGWKARAKVGTKKKWYKDVEEVAR